MATPPMLDTRQGAALRPSSDPSAALAVGLLVVTAVGLAVGGVLAIYDWRTPGAMGPLAAAIVALFGAALAVLVITTALRWLRAGRPR